MRDLHTTEPIRSGTTWIFPDGTTLPVISGGDGSTDAPRTLAELSAAIEGLDAITDADELAALSADIVATYEQVKADGPAEDETGAEFFATLTALRDGLKAVTDRQGELATATAEAEAMLTDLDAEMATLSGEITAEDAAALSALSDEDRAALDALDDDARAELGALVETEEEGQQQQPAAEVVEPPSGVEQGTDDGESTESTPAEPEPAEPAVLERAASALRASRRTRTAQPAPAPAPAPTRQAAAFGYDDGREMTDADVVTAMQRTAQRYGNAPGQERRVASVPLSPDVARIGDITDPSSWYDEALADLRAHRTGTASGTRQASGALCAPPLTDYSVVVIGTEDQPLRSAFPTVGGSEADNSKTLQFLQALAPGSIIDADGDAIGENDKGIGSATATENEAGTNYPKTAFVAECPEFELCEQRAHWTEIVFDNLNAFSYPEWVAAVQQSGRVAVAADAEEWRAQDIYDAADAANQVLTPLPQGFGGNHSLLSTILSLVTHDRSAKRDWSAPYVVGVPEWLNASLVTEVLATLDVASGSMSLDEARAELVRRYGITTIGYLGRFGKEAEANVTDGGEPTKLPALSGSVPLFPCEARIFVARDDAAFTRLGAELNLGMLRTEDDLENNNHRFFFEGWGRTCFRIPPIVADVAVDPIALTQASAEVATNCGSLSG